MSSTVDNRIVEMQFDNKRFEQNVSTSISTLDKLKEALKLDAASKGLDAIEKGFDKLNLSGVGSAVDVIAGRFSAMGVIATTILQDIGHMAFQAGQRLLGMVKSMTLDQVMSGWDKYADKTNSVKTIMAATGETWEKDADTLMQLNALTEQGFDPKNASSYLQTWKDVNSGVINTWQAAKQLGITVQEFQDKTGNFGEIAGLKYTGSQMDFVNSQMEKLNWFTDETSYNFTDMVSNIGKFTANNIPLSEATTAMQGIANWAAISGQKAGEASRAMYNLSQAIGTGSVKAIDWKSIENANMATSEFKQKAIEMAAANGTLKTSFDKTGKAIYKTNSGMEVTVENFRETLASGWFDKNTLMATLDQYGAFTDKLYDFSQATDLTATEILGLIDAQDAGTLSEEKLKAIADDHQISVDELRSSLTELGSDQYKFGRSAFVAAQQATSFQDAIDATKDAASTKWLNIFENIFGDYEKAKEIWTGFAEFLYDTLVAPLEKLEEISEILGELNAVKRIARGFEYLFSFFKGDGIDTFGVFDSIAKGFRMIFPPIENLKLAISKVLTAFTRWGKSIQLTEAQSKKLQYAAAGVAAVFKYVLNSIKNLWDATEPLRTALSGLAESIGNLLIKIMRVPANMDTTGVKAEWLNKICEKLAEVIDKVSEAIDKIKITDIRNKFKEFGDTLKTIWQSIVNVWNATEPLRISLVGLGEAIWGLIGRLFESSDGFEVTEYKAEGVKTVCEKLSEIIDKVAAAINGLSLEKIQKGFAKVAEVVDKVKTAFNNFINGIRNFSFGAAIGKTVDWIKEKFEGLKEFLSKFNIGKALLGGAAIGGGAVLGAGIIKLIKLIKNPLKAFDGIKEKIEGLLDSIGQLAGMKIDGALEGIKKLAVAILLLAAALLVLGFVDYDNAIFGIALIAGVLILFFKNLQAFEKIKASSIAKLAATMIAISASMLVFAVALAVLAGAIALFALVAKMDSVWKGLGVMAASLGILVVAMYLLSKVSPKVFIGAAALLVLSVALIALAGAIALFGLVAKMDSVWNGVGLMAASLGVLVVALLALSAMSPMIIVGAASILILSAALVVLAGVMAAFALIAGMENAWQGLGLMAAMLGVLVIALLALAPAALGVIGAAGALLLVAGACLVLAVAIGIVSLVLPLLGSGLQALAEGVSAGLSALGTGIADFGLGAASLIAEVSSAIALGVEQLLLSLGTGIGGAVSAIGQGLGEGIGAVGEGIGTALSGISEGVLAAFTALGEGIAALGAGIGEAAASIGSGAGEGISAAGAGIGEAIGSITSAISTGLTDIGLGITSLGEGIAGAISAIAESISGSLASLGEGISSFGEGTAELITSVLGAVALGVEEVVASVGKGIADGITAISNSVTDLGTGLGDLGTGITGFGDSMKSLNGIAWFDIGNGFREIASAIKTLKIGNLSETVNTASEGIVRACTEMSTAIQTALNDTYTLIDSGGETIVTNMQTGMYAKLSSARTAGVTVGSAVLTGIRTATANVFSVGRNASQGFINGFLSKELEAKLAGEKIAGKAIEGAEQKLKEASPSKVFFKIGDYATQGFINGLLAMEDKVEDSGASISQSAISSVIDSIAAISDLMDQNPEFNPTIRPVLDSSSVESGLSRLGAIGTSSYMDAQLNANQDLMQIQNGSQLLANALSNANSLREHEESSQFTAKDFEQFISIGNQIMAYVRDGHDIFFDDGTFAGRINRRLGSI